LAVLTNCVPGALAGVLSSTTVSWSSIWANAGMKAVGSPGKKSKVRKPPALENECGTGVVVPRQTAV
jgi:hypothetical protein